MVNILLKGNNIDLSVADEKYTTYLISAVSKADIGNVKISIYNIINSTDKKTELPHVGYQKGIYHDKVLTEYFRSQLLKEQVI